MIQVRLKQTFLHISTKRTPAKKKLAKQIRLSKQTHAWPCGGGSKLRGSQRLKVSIKKAPKGGETMASKPPHCSRCSASPLAPFSIPYSTSNHRLLLRRKGKKGVRTVQQQEEDRNPTHTAREHKAPTSKENPQYHSRSGEKAAAWRYERKTVRLVHL